MTSDDSEYEPLGSEELGSTETDEADAFEQRQEADPETDEEWVAADVTPLPEEADEADAVEQRRAEPSDRDEEARTTGES